MERDRVAAAVVLENIRAAVPSRWRDKVTELRAVANGDNSITLGRFLGEALAALGESTATQPSFERFG